MKLAKIKVYFGLSLLVFTVLLSNLGTPFSSLVVSAAQNDTSPPSESVNYKLSDHKGNILLTPPGWSDHGHKLDSRLSLSFVDRAHINVTFNDNGKPINNGKTFSQLIGGTYTLYQYGHHTGDNNGRTYLAAYCKSQPEFTNVDDTSDKDAGIKMDQPCISISNTASNFADTDNIGGALNDSEEPHISILEGNTAAATGDSSDADRRVGNGGIYASDNAPGDEGNSKFRVAFKSVSVGTLKTQLNGSAALLIGGDMNWFGPNVCPYEDTKNVYLTGQSDSQDTSKWVCNNITHDDSPDGYVVGQNFGYVGSLANNLDSSSADNYNIIYKASSDGQTLQAILPWMHWNGNNDSDDSSDTDVNYDLYKWCSSGNYYVLSGTVQKAATGDLCQSTTTNQSANGGYRAKIYGNGVNPTALSKSTGKTEVTVSDGLGKFTGTYVAGAGNKAVTGKTTGPTDGSGNGNGAETPGVSCNYSLFNPLSWFLCPLIELITGLVSSFDNTINNDLCVPVSASASGGSGTSYNDCTGNPISTDSSNGNTTTIEGYKKAWTAFRNIALGLVVVIGLIAVISQASGMQIFDAYTIKKTMPRLIFAAIAMTLSWSLLRWFISLTNDLGFGVRQIIYHAVNPGTANFDLPFMDSFFAGAGIALLGFMGLLSFGGTALLFLAVTLLALTIRQVAIIALVIFSPIALMLYAAPFGQKFGQMWWKEFTQLTMTFPIVAGAIALGHVFGVMTLNSHNFGSAIIGFTAYLAGDAAAVAILAKRGMIMGMATGALQKAAQPGFNMVKGYRKNRISKNAEKWQNRWKGWQQTTKTNVDRKSLRGRFESARSMITDPGTELKGRIGQVTRALGSRLAGLKDTEATGVKGAAARFIGRRGEHLERGTGIIGAGGRLADRTAASLVHEKLEHDRAFTEAASKFMDDKGAKIVAGDFEDYEKSKPELHRKLTDIKNTKNLSYDERFYRYAEALHEHGEGYRSEQLSAYGKLTAGAKYDQKMRRADVKAAALKLYGSGGKANGAIMADMINDIKAVHGAEYGDEVGRQAQEIAVRSGRDDLVPGRGLQVDDDGKTYYVFDAAAKLAKATSMDGIGINLGNGNIDEARKIVNDHMSDVFNKFKSQTLSGASSEMLRDLGFDLGAQDITQGSGWAMLQNWARGDIGATGTPDQIAKAIADHQDKARDIIMGLSLAIGQYGGGDLKQKDTYRNLLSQLDFPVEDEKREAARLASAQQRDLGERNQARNASIATATALNLSGSAIPSSGQSAPQPIQLNYTPPQAPAGSSVPINQVVRTGAPNQQGAVVIGERDEAGNPVAAPTVTAAEAMDHARQQTGPGVVYQPAPTAPTNQAPQGQFMTPGQQLVANEQLAQTVARETERQVTRALDRDRRERQADAQAEKVSFLDLAKEYSPYANYDPRNAALLNPEVDQQNQQAQNNQNGQGGPNGGGPAPH